MENPKNTNLGQTALHEGEQLWAMGDAMGKAQTCDTFIYDGQAGLSGSNCRRSIGAELGWRQ
jgi:hypothetical protein